jgi:hypothetical protein
MLKSDNFNKVDQHNDDDAFDEFEDLNIRAEKAVTADDNLRASEIQMLYSKAQISKIIKAAQKRASRKSDVTIMRPSELNPLLAENE